MELRNKRTLTLLVAVLAAVAATLTVLLVGGGAVELAFALGGGLLVALVLAGTYSLSTRAGHPHSHAVAVATVLLGVIYLLGLVVRLLTQFPA